MPGIFSKIFGAGGEAVAKPISAIGDVLDGLFTSKEEKLTHEEIMERIKQEPAKAQVALNKIEAAHKSVFVAGWRPFIGWVCGVSLGAFYIPQFVLASYLWVKMCLEANELLAYPDVSVNSLFELVLALLGMAGLRSWEKYKGVAR